MLLQHEGASPRVDPSAWVAPTATLVGDVTVGPGSTVSFGAVLVAESGPVTVGRECVVMESAVLRGVSRHPLTLDDHVLVGPHAHLSGCRVERDVFLATGCSVFNGAVVEEGSTVRIGGIVHVRTRLPAGTLVPIHWVAVGDPAEILPPDADGEISERLRERDFSSTVFGLGERSVTEMTRRYTRALMGMRGLVSLRTEE